MKPSQALFRRLPLAAAILGLMAAFAPSAQASFTYSVAPTTTTTAFGAASSLTITAFNNGAPSQVLSGNQGISLAQVTIASTQSPTTTDVGVIPLPPLVVTINNQNGGGSGIFTITGNINVTRSDTGGAQSTFSLTSIVPPTINLGNFIYSLSNIVYTQPTVNAAIGSPGAGSFSVTITETPEPASMALMGIGVAVVAGAALRRRRSV